MRYLQQPPIWRNTSAPVLAIEQAVWHFHLYFKQILPVELRRRALGICRLVVHTCPDKPHQAQRVQWLFRAIADPDDCRLALVGCLPPLSGLSQHPSGV